MAMVARQNSSFASRDWVAQVMMILLTGDRGRIGADDNHRGPRHAPTPIRDAGSCPARLYVIYWELVWQGANHSGHGVSRTGRHARVTEAAHSSALVRFLDSPIITKRGVWEMVARYTTLVLLLCAAAALGQQDSAKVSKKVSIGVGYDEGLALRVDIVDRVGASLSTGYNSKAADSVYHLATNVFWGKLGAVVLIKKVDSFRLNAFLEVGEVIEALETGQMVRNGSTQRYYTWNTFGRIGVCPEFRIANHISIAYKVGLEGIVHGTHYRLDPTTQQLVDKEDSYFESGVYGAGSRVPMYGSDNVQGGLLAHNLSLYITF
jgi:hypothetical protein